MWKSARTMTRHYKSITLNHKNELSEADIELLENLKRKIGTPIDLLKRFNKSAFVRLSTRSPKDAGICGNSALKQQLSDEINVFKRNGYPVNPNVKLQALFNVSARVLEVATPDQALHLLLSSERIYGDLQHALERDLSLWDMNVIIREFVKLDVSYEFRGFVCKKVLTAVCQYNDMCFYPHLKGKEVEIVDKLFNFFLTIRDLVGYDAYVLDFVIIGEDVKIIEINPFGLMTGSSLFQWEADRYLLQGGVDLYGDLPSEIKCDDIHPREAAEAIIAEFTSTNSFENGWKTILRLNSRVPDRINSEYIDVLYGGTFKSQDDEKLWSFSPVNPCLVM